MKAVVSAKQMADMDAHSINKLKIPGLVLMENAGVGIVKSCLSVLTSAAGKRVVIYCGPGNNGGDGYVVARHLANAGASVNVFVLADRSKIKGDALTNLQAIEKMGLSVRFLDRAHKIPACDLIVDAMLGTGVTGAPRGIFAEMIGRMNQSPAPVVAVDIPTGINADTGAVEGDAVEAVVTATMACLKSGLLLSPGRDHAGRVDVVDISMPAAVVKELPHTALAVEEFDIISRLPGRPSDTFKNRCGTVATVAGSTGFTGAAALCSHAVLRAGAGLSYLAIPGSLNWVMESKLTEVITWPLDDAGQGYFILDSYHELIDKVTKQDVVAIGPGLGQHPGTGRLLVRLLRELKKPLVLDADGLNLFAGKIDELAAYGGGLVVTPHPGELARLMDVSAKEIVSNKLLWAAEAAKRLKCVVVLKGGPTVIAEPGGQLFINTTGNAGMATAGSGDVLTGVIGGLMAQGLSPVDAALAGVYVHGLAGDLAAQQLGQLAMVASDILNCVPAALSRLATGEHG